MKDPSLKAVKKRRFPIKRFYPKFDTEPERVFRNDVIAKTVPTEKYVTNEAFFTKFRVYPIYPDVRFISIPVVVEVKGVHWHKSKTQIKKDKAKVECYLGEKYYYYDCTDVDLKKSLEEVRLDFKRFVEEARRNKFEHPTSRTFRR